MAPLLIPPLKALEFPSHRPASSESVLSPHFESRFRELILDLQTESGSPCLYRVHLQRHDPRHPNTESLKEIFPLSSPGRAAGWRVTPLPECWWQGWSQLAGDYSSLDEVLLKGDDLRSRFILGKLLQLDDLDEKHAALLLHRRFLSPADFPDTGPRGTFIFCCPHCHSWGEEEEEAATAGTLSRFNLLHRSTTNPFESLTPNNEPVHCVSCGIRFFSYSSFMSYASSQLHLLPEKAVVAVESLEYECQSVDLLNPTQGRFKHVACLTPLCDLEFHFPLPPLSSSQILALWMSQPASRSDLLNMAQRVFAAASTDHTHLLLGVPLSPYHAHLDWTARLNPSPEVRGPFRMISHQFDDTSKDDPPPDLLENLALSRTTAEHMLELLESQDACYFHVVPSGWSWPQFWIRLSLAQFLESWSSPEREQIALSFLDKLKHELGLSKMNSSSSSDAQPLSWSLGTSYPLSNEMKIYYEKLSHLAPLFKDSFFSFKTKVI